jgi:putative transposase
MPEYRRWYIPGGTYFFTIVTQERLRIFHDPIAVRLLGQVMRAVRVQLPFHTIAIVLLPDHLHCVWSLPVGDCEFSNRWKLIKGSFTEEWLAAGGSEARSTPSKIRKGEHGVWQRRFWEHQIRDEFDLERHVDYIHYNPVKHGYVARPSDWPWSSFSHHVRLGQYPSDWGAVEPEMPSVIPRE